MAAFAVLCMFFVGVGVGAWAATYYRDVVSPDRTGSNEIERALELIERLGHGAHQATTSMRSVSDEETDRSVNRTEARPS